MNKCLRLLALIAVSLTLDAQVYSPKLLREGQADSTDLKKFAEVIYMNAGARNSREKAEAIWRFFLTDGRFVKPGFWYHVAGWTYEEPTGEVLDPIKLINSYGFGLCYHIAPLLEAVFEAGGFADARCWFLTGHTVAEVFYDGGYHYFDSDMMGYNVAGDGSFHGKPVASVRALEQDGNIILSKLQTPESVKPGEVDEPWYPADVRAKAMKDLAGLFTTAANNYLYPFTRYSPGHAMDFVLRPGETLTRFFAPEEPGLFYLPYKFDGKNWSEFPQELPEYHIRTADGPRSQKDDRLWATGRIEYSPRSLPKQAVTVIEMPSPYVIIDARFSMRVNLPGASSQLHVETSTDGGETWQLAGELHGPFHDQWSTEPKVLVQSAHGRLTAVSGSYGYKIRLTVSNNPEGGFTELHLLSRIQLNPRTLPQVEAGVNRFVYSVGPSIERLAVPVRLDSASMRDLELVNQNAQSFLRPQSGKAGEAVYVVEANGAALTGFDVGARFLDLTSGWAPDKLTAETRRLEPGTNSGPASLSWSTAPEGPFRELWSFPERLQWRDGDTIDRVLRWPEVFRQVRDLPSGTRRVYVKLRSAGPALDSVRLAAHTAATPQMKAFAITQVWREGTVRRTHTEHARAGTEVHTFTVRAGANVRNEAVIFSND